MKTDILSLRNLYQFLFVDDYPIFSTGIISKSNRVGLTLTKFWYKNLLIDFRNQKYGKRIWRTEGGRNRYISEICNRSDRLLIYREYAKEVCQVADSDTVLRQIKQFMFLLTERDFSYVVFMQKLQAYLKLLRVNDVAFSKEADHFFHEALLHREDFEKLGVNGQTFFCSWFLTLLMIHALLGNGEGEEYLCQVRTNQELSVTFLGEVYLKDEKSSRDEVLFLTTKNSELCKEPLDIRHFFGREEELFELREMLEAGGKYLVSGIGGIGKTELMRQFLKNCQEEKLVDYICVVQYEGNMAESLIRAFAKVRGADKEEKLQEVLAFIRMHASKKVLLVVDNVNQSIEKDEDIGLLWRLPFTVFVTSRHQRLEGFETYEVRPIAKGAGGLIFRDNYKLPLNKEDRQVLENLLNKKLWCHTLTLRLLGRATRVKGWTLQELLNIVETGTQSIGLDGQAGYKNLQEVYRQMYCVSGMAKELNCFLQVFALLPYGSYERKMVQKYMHGFFPDRQAIDASLTQLWECGWLEKHEDKYSMHPFVAECLLVKEPEITDAEPLLDAVVADWEAYSPNFITDGFVGLEGHTQNNPISEELKEVTMLVAQICRKLTGALKEKYFQLLLLALSMEAQFYGITKERQEQLLNWKERCNNYSAITDIGVVIAECVLSINADGLSEKYDRIRKNAEYPQQLKNIYFCKLVEMLYAIECVELAEKVAGYCWEEGCDSNVKMAGAVILGNITLDRGNIEECIEWMRKGRTLGKENHLDKSEQMYRVNANLANLMIAVGRFDEAEALFEEIKGIVGDNEGIYEKWIRLFSMGSLKANRRVEDCGMKELTEAVELAESLFVERNEMNRLNSMAELAMAYDKAKMREEASRWFEKAIEVCGEIQASKHIEHRIVNNMGVMFLDWEKYDEAKKYLTKGYELGNALGGIALGEAANNMSKLWRALKDREKEMEYLRQALPILEQIYGSEHPKVLDAKKRSSC